MRPAGGREGAARVLSVDGVIEIRGLTKRYGDCTAVDDLTVTIHPGRVAGFLGPNGDAVVSPRVTRRLLETLAHRLPAGTPPDPRVALLTERELEVLRAVARGESNAEIAAGLVLSELTVKTHVARTLGKLEVRDRTQAAVFAHTHGLV